MPNVPGFKRGWPSAGAELMMVPPGGPERVGGGEMVVPGVLRKGELIGAGAAGIMGTVGGAT